MPSVDDTTFLGLRTLLVTGTGHYHLVGTQSSGGDTIPDYTVDAGANFYIQKALRWCDRHARHCRKLEKADVTVGADVSSVAVTAHSVTEVRITDQTTPLLQADEDWLRKELDEADLTAVASALKPLYWAPKMGEADDTTRSIWIMPPPTAAKTAEVRGMYYTAALSGDSDTNWWTLNFSELVLYVAMQMVNDLDLNPFTNATLMRLIEDVKRQMIIDDVQEEVAYNGTTMAG